MARRNIVERYGRATVEKRIEIILDKIDLLAEK